MATGFASLDVVDFEQVFEMKAPDIHEGGI